MKTQFARSGRRARKRGLWAAMLILAALSLALSACDGDATYTPPPPTAIGKDEPATVESPAVSEQSTPTQVVASTPVPIESPTPLPPPATKPEDYPAPPTLAPVTPQAYPQSSGGS